MINRWGGSDSKGQGQLGGTQVVPAAQAPVQIISIADAEPSEWTIYSEAIQWCNVDNTPFTGRQSIGQAQYGCGNLAGPNPYLQPWLKISYGMHDAVFSQLIVSANRPVTLVASNISVDAFFGDPTDASRIDPALSYRFGAFNFRAWATKGRPKRLGKWYGRFGPNEFIGLNPSGNINPVNLMILQGQNTGIVNADTWLHLVDGTAASGRILQTIFVPNGQNFSVDFEDGLPFAYQANLYCSNSPTAINTLGGDIAVSAFLREFRAMPLPS